MNAVSAIFTYPNYIYVNQAHIRENSESRVTSLYISETGFKMEKWIVRFRCLQVIHKLWVDNMMCPRSVTLKNNLVYHEKCLKKWRELPKKFVTDKRTCPKVSPSCIIFFKVFNKDINHYQAVLKHRWQLLNCVMGSQERWHNESGKRGNKLIIKVFN